MTSKIYASTAHSSRLSGPRVPLFSALALFGFALLAVAPLLLIYPEKEMTEKVTHTKLGDPVTVSYLTNLLRTDPNNMELRVLLAEHKLYLGKLNDVPSLLEPVLKWIDSEWHTKAQVIEIQYLVQLLATKQNDVAAYSRIAAVLHEKMQGLISQPMSREGREYLALQALNLNRPDWAVELYHEVAKSDPMLRADWYAEVAARMVSFSQYESAAEFYFKAQHHSVSKAEQKRYFFLGMRVLMSGNLFSAAMQAADNNLGSLRDDAETLYFLAKTALAANDAERADFYAKKLLHISWQDMRGPQWSILNISLINSAYASDQIVNDTDTQGMRAFNADYYALAYQVFLANHNLNDAFRVAEVAVRQVPESSLWHQRLAEVSEWLGKSDVALREWNWLVSHNHSQAALMGVMRLAPGMQDDESLLLAWMTLADKQSLDKTQARTMAELYEKTDHVKEGIAFFKKRYLLTRNAIFLEQVAYLAERSGDEKTAQESDEQLLEQHGFRDDTLFRLATFEMKQGHPENALRWLNKYRADVASSNKDYWKLLADLSWRLQQDDEAKNAYQHLAAEKNLALEDISRYIYLLGDSQRVQAAALAELGYQEFANQDMLLYALEIYDELHDRPSQQRLFESAVNNQKINFKNNARFYLLRARFQNEMGFFIAAKADFLRAIKIAPDDKGIIDALFWFLIDTHDQSGISKIMELIQSKGATHDPFYWSAFAAGYQVLEQPKLALSYLTEEVKHKPKDFLWQLNYAEALDQVGQSELALQVRRKAWGGLLAQRAKIADSLPMTSDLESVVRLDILSQPNDYALSLMRSLLRQDRLVKSTVAQQDALNQLVLVWSLSQEQSANAKAWLWLRYAHMQTTYLAKTQYLYVHLHDAMSLSLTDELFSQMASAQNMPEVRIGDTGLQLLMDEQLRLADWGNDASVVAVQKQTPPVWATSLLALEENDTEQLDKLFQRDKNSMPVKNRSDAALALGSIANAQEIVFDSLTRNPDDEELQARQLNNGIAGSGFIESSFQHQQIATWRGSQSILLAEMPLTADTRIGIMLSGAAQTNSDATLITPLRQQVRGLQIKTKSFLGDSEMLWQQRSEFAKTDALTLNQMWKVNGRLDMQAHALYHAETNDSLGLRTMGMQNGFSGNINYLFGQREYFNLQSGMSDYVTQQGMPLGHGAQWTWEMGYRIQKGYPDWSVSLHGSQQNISPLPAGLGILPLSNQMYAVCSNLGTSIQSQYTYAWLPYLNTCVSNSSASGQGYNMDVGLIGVVFGHDQASIVFGQGKSSTISNMGATRQLAVRYRYFFDQH